MRASNVGREALNCELWCCGSTTRQVFFFLIIYYVARTRLPLTLVKWTRAESCNFEIIDYRYTSCLYWRMSNNFSTCCNERKLCVLVRIYKYIPDTSIIMHYFNLSDIFLYTICAFTIVMDHLCSDTFSSASSSGALIQFIYIISDTYMQKLSITRICLHTHTTFLICFYRNVAQYSAY